MNNEKLIVSRLTSGIKKLNTIKIPEEIINIAKNLIIDISGLTFNGQIRPSYDSSTLTATFTISIVTAASGIYKLQLADTVTKDISSGRYVYDVMMTLADSTIEVVHKGILTVNPRVTQL